LISASKDKSIKVNVIYAVLAASRGVDGLKSLLG